MPFKPRERQYRAFLDISAVDHDSESEARASYIVEGYATTFDVPYDFGHGGAKECISSRALDGADMSDVIFQLNHEGPVMARQRNGSLVIQPDAHGLHIRADLGGSQYGRDLHEAIRAGLIDRMSWAFLIADDGWEWDPETRVSTITKISKVFDVSAVSRPADEDTEIHARSYLDGVIEAEQKELLLRDRELRRRAAASLELITL